MTEEEAKDWYDQTSEKDRIKIFMDYYKLKQDLCALTIVVPTGCSNWIQRAIRRVQHLRESEGALRHLIREGADLLEETARRTHYSECTNCMGTGKTDDHSCCVCKGTGKRKFSY